MVAAEPGSCRGLRQQRVLIKSPGLSRSHRIKRAAHASRSFNRVRLLTGMSKTIEAEIGPGGRVVGPVALGAIGGIGYARRHVTRVRRIAAIAAIVVVVVRVVVAIIIGIVVTTIIAVA